jgi:hypothetical protein
MYIVCVSNKSQHQQQFPLVLKEFAGRRIIAAACRLPPAACRLPPAACLQQSTYY